MTTRSIFWRLFWKEYRLQRALWIAMTALTAVVILSLFAFASHQMGSPPGYWFIAAYGLPPFFLLGCGASLFAGERESGTYQFQRALPVSAWRVFAAKIAFALVGVVAMFVATWMLALCLSGEIPPHNHCKMLGTASLFGLEMFLWTVFFSLLSRRVLVAAIFGVTAASLSINLFFPLVAVKPSLESYWTLYYVYRAVVAAILAVVDVWLGVRWFHNRRDPYAQADTTSLEESTPAQTAASFASLQYIGQWTLLSRLVWQHWRQSWRTMAVILAMLIPLSFMSVEGFRGLIVWPVTGWLDRSIDPLSYLAAFLVLASIPLLGTTAFMADQRRRGFRFLTDRGAPPKRVWLSRLVILFAICTLAAVILLVVNLAGSVILTDELRRFAADSSQLFPPGVWSFAKAMNVAFLALGYIVLGLSVGQFCSMFLRSNLLAGLFSIVLTAILVAWSALMWFWEVPWLWSVVPIPLVLLLATRVRARDWLLERNTPRAWLRTAAATLLPAIALFVAVPSYRVHTIPNIDPGISVEEFHRTMTLEEQATFDLYRQAVKNTIKLPHWKLPHYSPSSPNCFEGQKKLVAPTAQEIACINANHAWVDANHKTIAQAMKASHGKLFNPTGEPLNPPYSFTESLDKLAQLLICSAESLEERGRLDEAFEQYAAAIRVAVHLCEWRRMPITMEDYYDYRDHNTDRIEAEVYERLPGWAARPGQTPERIVAAAKELERLTAASSSIQGIKLTYCRMRSFLTAEPSEADQFGGSVPWGTMIWNRLPWERARALRMLNWMTRNQLNVVERAEKQARSNEQILRMYPRPEESVSPWSEYGDYPYALRRQINVPPVLYGVHYEMVNTYAALETSRRATRLILALEAWKLRHGSLPKKLDQLVGSCIDRMPVDPYSGKPFRYCRDGLKVQLHWIQPKSNPRIHPTSGTINANVPFVWSAGANPDIVSNSNALEAGMRNAYIGDLNDLADRSRQPGQEDSLWQSGWPFPIP